MTVRWIFTDPSIPESFSVPINPNQMDSPHQVRNVSMAAGEHGAGTRRVRIVERSQQVPKEWSFGGVIRTQAHHDELLRWTQKKAPIHITDHLGRTFEVVIKTYDPIDRRSMANVPWRLTFTMSCFLLKEI